MIPKSVLNSRALLDSHPTEAILSLGHHRVYPQQPESLPLVAASSLCVTALLSPDAISACTFAAPILLRKNQFKSNKGSFIY